LNFTDLIAVIIILKSLIILINLFYLIIKSKKKYVSYFTNLSVRLTNEKGAATRQAPDLLFFSKSCPTVIFPTACGPNIKINFNYTPYDDYRNNNSYMKLNDDIPSQKSGFFKMPSSPFGIQVLSFHLVEYRQYPLYLNQS
jgi:hypothetical protein